MLSVTHVSTREHGDVPVEAVARNHLDVQRLCITALPHTECDAVESWFHLLAKAALGRASPVTCPGKTEELVHGGGHEGGPAGLSV